MGPGERDKTEEEMAELTVAAKGLRDTLTRDARVDGRIIDDLDSLTMSATESPASTSDSEVAPVRFEGRWSREPLLSEVLASATDAMSLWKRPEKSAPEKSEPEKSAPEKSAPEKSAVEEPPEERPGDELPPPIPSPERAEVKDRNYGLKKTDKEPRKLEDHEAKAERMFKARQDRLTSLQSIARTSLDLARDAGAATSRGLGSAYHRYK